MWSEKAAWRPDFGQGLFVGSELSHLIKWSYNSKRGLWNLVSTWDGGGEGPSLLANLPLRPGIKVCGIGSLISGLCLTLRSVSTFIDIYFREKRILIAVSLFGSLWEGTSGSSVCIYLHYYIMGKSEKGLDPIIQASPERLAKWCHWAMPCIYYLVLKYFGILKRVPLRTISELPRITY